MRQREFINQKHARNYSGLGTTFLRAALLFGSIAVALSLVLIPVLVNKIEDRFSNSLFEPHVDRVSTGSISPNSLSYDNKPIKRMQFNFNESN